MPPVLFSAMNVQRAVPDGAFEWDVLPRLAQLRFAVLKHLNSAYLHARGPAREASYQVLASQAEVVDVDGPSMLALPADGKVTWLYVPVL